MQLQSIQIGTLYLMVKTIVPFLIFKKATQNQR